MDTKNSGQPPYNGTLCTTGLYIVHIFLPLKNGKRLNNGQNARPNMSIIWWFYCMCIEMGREKRRKGELAWWVPPGGINQERGRNILYFPLATTQCMPFHMYMAGLWIFYPREESFLKAKLCRNIFLRNFVCTARNSNTCLFWLFPNRTICMGKGSSTEI